jgi:GNAT superfamily N-acetyltransferase
VGYTLVRPATAEQWQAFHDIRRSELFEARGRYGIYDANHPDDANPGNEPLLLWLDGRPIGTARLDSFGDGLGVMRLVAIRAPEQGRGHGRKLDEMVEQRAHARGMHTLYVNAAPTAVGFYERTGWTRYVWSEEELAGIAADCVQMRKQIG